MDTTYILAAIILFAASFTQGFSGFGFALVSIPLLSLIVDIKYAIPLGALCGLVVNIYLAVHLHKHINFFDLKQLFIGALFGVPVGVLVLSEFDQGILKTILGVLVLLFVLLSLTNFAGKRKIKPGWGYLFGFLSGLFGGAFNTNGPPVLVYFYIQGWDKVKLKSMITGYFIFTSVIIVAAHALSGVTTQKVFKDFLIFLPVVLIGIVSGNSLFKRVSAEAFNKIILTALIVISLFLIIG